MLRLPRSPLTQFACSFLVVSFLISATACDTPVAPVTPTVILSGSPAPSLTLPPPSPTTTPSAPGIVGLWEKETNQSADNDLVSQMRIGDQIQFFNDGTVSYASEGGNYTWIDNNHLKLVYVGNTFVYDLSLTADELTIYSGQGHYAHKFAHYDLLTPQPTNIEGDWVLSQPDESKCFNGLGLDHSPPEFVIGPDQVFKYDEHTGLGGANHSYLDGRYAFDGNRLAITAKGAIKTGPLTIKDLNGNLDCVFRLSHTRLELINSNGEVTLYRKMGK